MNYCITGFDDWPRERGKIPKMRHIADALLYAQLIYNKPAEQTLIEIYMNDCYIKTRAEREDENPNIDEMVFLIHKGRLFRMCLEECERIKKEVRASI